MKITIPELSLVTLVGVTGSGKSTFGRKHFAPFEVVSSDFCRGMVSNDENDQTVTDLAFELLHDVLRKRLKLGRLTVVDATNVRPEDRRELVAIAREYHVLPVAIVFDLPERVCHERNAGRTDRAFGPHVIRSQALRRHVRGLGREGFRHVFVLRSPAEVDAATVVREPLWNNRKGDRGPFDIIGDVHGCLEELVELLRALGYSVERGESEGDRPWRVTAPAGRNAVFLGDLVDRGPGVAEVLKLVMGMVSEGVALCVPGNHDVKLMRWLRGKNVQVTHGLEQSIEQLARESDAFRAEVAAFIDSLVSHYVLDGGALVVAHAGLKESMQGRGSGKVRDFCLFGETTGETDEFGLPVRYNWAAEYRGRAAVVYGHTPTPRAEWLNGTINIDTGCVFGGRLTALRWPERELVSVAAKAVYAEPARLLGEPAKTQVSLEAQHEADDVLDLRDVFGKRLIHTELMGNVTIREENGAAALEVMSRYAANPRWLVYLPPTMSPCTTSGRPEWLEHPDEAFGYYRSIGVPCVVCEEKHMGSRAVAIVCRDEEAARRRFGVIGEGIGIVYTRTGRPFFNEDEATEQALLQRLHRSVTAAGLWEELASDWFLFDCELMPWSAKAQELLRGQYAAVGAAGGEATALAAKVLAGAAARVAEAAPLAAFLERSAAVGRFVDAYRRYCWPVAGVEDLRLAPFHLLASEGKVHVDRDHPWHMGIAQRLGEAGDAVVMATNWRVVDLGDESCVAEGVAWWESLTVAGGEGMVVKPVEFVCRGGRGIEQPAVKCRGREYLRIIYGPEYTRAENLDRLRARGLGRKRGLALREFALGVEGLERFARREPLRRVHECVFGVLALESEPVDPRL